MWSALSDERSALSFVRVIWSAVLSQLSICTVIYILPLINYSYIQYIQGLLSVQAEYNRLCPIFSIFRYDGSLERSYA
jgi:hypothetical protein